MVQDGRYVYCVAETGDLTLGTIGLRGGEVTSVPHQDIAAIVSPVPFIELQADVDSIFAHQRVVDASRRVATTLPVKFGTVLRTDESVRRWLRASYGAYRKKLETLAGKDEYGVKIILDNKARKHLSQSVTSESEEARKLSSEISKSGQGASYLLKIRRDEVVKAETLRRIDGMVDDIHKDLARAAADSSLLRSDLPQVVLNAAYLVTREGVGGFDSRVDRLKKEYGPRGLTIHVSGPWAPYSFC